MPQPERKMLLDEIDELLEITREQIQSFHEQEGRLPQIELDIVQSNLRKIYEKVNVLNRINPGMPSSEPVSGSLPLGGVRLKFEGALIENPVHSSPMPAAPAKEFDQPSVPEPPKSISQPPKPVRPPSPSPDLFTSDAPTLADRLKDEKPSVIDRITEQIEDKSIAGNLMQKPLADIRAAIGINEKFLFINELFGGSLQEYNQAIQALNQAGQLETALEIFRSYQERLRWSPKLPAALKLKELVQRRYL